MRLLLDTNVFLALAHSPDRLRRLLEPLGDPTTERLVSAVVGWEVAIKWKAGRLPLPMPPAEFMPLAIGKCAATAIDITHAHAIGVADLPHHHRDPFDRLLISQARSLGIPIATTDRTLAEYDVEVLLP